MASEFSRMEMLIGPEGLLVLQNSHVAVFGLGGVGSYAAEALARSGIGAMTLIDADTISETNLNRQLYALHSTLGRYKTDVAQERILDINPDCHVRKYTRFYLPENAETFFDQHFDYMIDAIDTVSAKLDLAVRAEKMAIPLISSMGTGNKLDPTRLRVADLYETCVCPLCRVMRRELKKRGVDRLRVVFSEEEPIRPGACGEETNKRATPGSIAFVPPVAGLLLAGEAVRGLLAAGRSPEK